MKTFFVSNILPSGIYDMTMYNMAFRFMHTKFEYKTKIHFTLLSQRSFVPEYLILLPFWAALLHQNSQ